MSVRSKNQLEETKGNYLYQYLATATGTLAVITSGMHFGWPSPSLPLLLSKDSSIPITSSDGSWLAVMPCIGAPPGALAGAYIVDRIGRKSTMLIVSPFYFIAWIGIAYAPNLSILYMARFIVGIMDGFTFTVLPMYIGEISDRNIRGFLGCSISFTFIAGFLLINILGLYSSITTTALISSSVPILHLLTFVWMPESPYYYLIKRDQERAISSLKKLTNNVDAKEVVTQLMVENDMNGEHTVQHLNLFKKKSNRKALAIVLGLRIIQQFSGNYTIAFYCLTIFNEADGFISSSTATIVYFVVQLLITVISSIFVDKIGRRPLLITSAFGSGLALIIQAVYFYLKKHTSIDTSALGYVPLTALLLYIVLFSIGLSNIPILVLGEYFPTDVKAIAMCIVDTVYGAVITIASKYFQIVADEYGMHVPFFTFAVCCLLGLIFIVLYVPETKGKSLEQIQKELKGTSTPLTRKDSSTEQQRVQQHLLSEHALKQT